MAELMLGVPLFPGESGVDQLVEIIKVLGTPTREQIKNMNPNYTDYKFPQIKASTWSKVFKSRSYTSDSLEFLPLLLDYTPTIRLTATEAMVHPFFDELRNPDTRLPSGRELPPLFDFTEEELSNFKPDQLKKLVPAHAVPELRQRHISLDSLRRVPKRNPKDVSDASQSLAGNPNNIVSPREGDSSELDR